MSSRRVRTIVAVILLSAAPRASDAANGGRRPTRVHPTTSLAQPPAEEQACLAAFRSAEMHVQAGELRAAKKQLLDCAQPSCGKFLRRQCASRFGDLEPEVPSVIPLVKDDAGKIVRDVSVAVDGEPAALPADGHAIFVDPGFHKFTFSADGQVIARETVTILPGQRNRLVRAALKSDGDSKPVPVSRRSEPKAVKLAALADEPAPRAPAPEEVVARVTDEPAAEPAPSAGRPMLAFALGGTGLVAVGAGVLLTRWGRADNQRLAACSPACPGAAVSHVHQLYVGADVAFGVGAAALAGATWAYFRHRSHKAEAAGEPALDVDVRPTSTGAIAGVRGTF